MAAMTNGQEDRPGREFLHAPRHLDCRSLACSSFTATITASMMRSVKYLKHGGPEVLELFDDPETMVRPDEILIDVHAVSVNPIDWKIRAGLVRGLPPSFPASTGRDGAGIVRAVSGATEQSL